MIPTTFIGGNEDLHGRWGPSECQNNTHEYANPGRLQRINCVVEELTALASQAIS